MRLRERWRMGGENVMGWVACASFVGLSMASIHGLPLIFADTVVPVTLGVELVLSLTVTPEDGLAIPLLPNIDGAFSSKTLMASVGTNNITGFKLTFSAGEGGTALINLANNQTNTLPTTSGDVASGRPMDINTWGFGVPMNQSDSVGLFPNDATMFNGEYPDIESGPASTSAYAEVPTYEFPITLKETSSLSGQNDDTLLSLGALMNTAKPAGSYRGTVVFSAVGNYVEGGPVGPCYNGEVDSPCQIDRSSLLIPVKYTGTDDSPEWSKADVDEPGDWYDYGKGQWANGVIIETWDGEGWDWEKEVYYQDAPAGTVIPEEDILSYYVYIPRFAYEVKRSSLTNYAVCGDGTYSSGTCSDNGASAFNIIFQTSDDPNLTPYGVNGDGTGVCEAYAGAYKDCAGSNNKYWTHPAFYYSSPLNEKINGIWVGKFEATSFSSATTNNNYLDDVIDEEYFQYTEFYKILPNVFSRRGQSMANQQGTIWTRNFGAGDNTSRMAKNIDWGAILYLSMSNYGRANASSGIDIWTNNCYSSVNSATSPRYVTGVAGNSANESYTDSVCYGLSSIEDIPSENQYFGVNGVHASTTDNVYGIYDMSGGAAEYLSSNYGDGDVIRTGSSGYINQAMVGFFYFLNTDKTNFSVYSSTQFGGSDYTRVNDCTLSTCGGQALFETMGVRTASSSNQLWGSKNLAFVSSAQPWMLRGGTYAGGGALTSEQGDGSGGQSYSYRIIVHREDRTVEY